MKCSRCGRINAEGDKKPPCEKCDGELYEACCDTNPDQPICADIRCVRRFHSYLKELPSLWRPGSMRWMEMRFWGIESNGSLTAIPAYPGDVPNWLPDADLIRKAMALENASFWVAQHQPQAIVIAAEAWVAEMSDENAARVQRVFGRTPDMMVASNRIILESRYGAKLRESLVVYGEMLGHPPVFAAFDIGGDILKQQNLAGNAIATRFAGILRGIPGWARLQSSNSKGER